MPSISEKPVEIWGGMECTINRVGNAYFNQLEYSGHLERPDDIALFAGLGIKKMRYPILWEQHQTADFEKTASRLEELRNRGIGMIAGLVHHGSGPEPVHMLEENFAAGLAEYAGEVARRFPWIDHYTPVNEPLTTARFCGLYGIWHPHERSDRSFCRILINECRATILAMQAIWKINPAAKLVQTEDLGIIHSTPLLKYQADFENERRWLSIDLLCGKVNASHALWTYLLDSGIAPGELAFFHDHACPPDVLGFNHYLTSERYLDENLADYPQEFWGGNGNHHYADVEAVRVATAVPAGLAGLLKQAWERYGLPIAVTEVHLACSREEQMRWLLEAWQTACRLKAGGIPVVAVTPWALLGSYGWNRLLTGPKGAYEPGLFDLSGGSPKPTVLAAMVKAFANNQTFEHPVLLVKGWWHRSSRVIYGQPETQERISGPAIRISGSLADDLSRICQERGINYQLEAGGCTNLWAVIEAGDSMIIRIEDRADLIIALPEFHPGVALWRGLDLMLDGETGYWSYDADGELRQGIDHNAPYLLAS
jgi:dTDP-4-dehydrorhamnose reductase